MVKRGTVWNNVLFFEQVGSSSHKVKFFMNDPFKLVPRSPTAKRHTFRENNIPNNNNRKTPVLSVAWGGPMGRGGGVCGKIRSTLVSKYF